MVVQALSRPTLLLTGVAEGLGASIAETFAGAGYDILGLARSDRTSEHLARLVGQRGSTYVPLICDLAHPTELADALGPHLDGIGVVVHNAHSLLIKPATDTTADEFEHIWRVACFGAFLTCRAVLPHMVASGNRHDHPDGRDGRRSGRRRIRGLCLGQVRPARPGAGLAREFGPKGIHVAHVVLDGLIEEVQTEQRFGPSTATRMDPDAVARAYLDLATQHRSAWTHELDMRPYTERF